MSAPLKHAEHAGGGGATLAALPVELSTWASVRRRAADFCELAKLRISVLVLLVTAVGYCLARPGGVDRLSLLHVLLGTGLVAVGANTLNQVWERRFDRLMRRTADRPIPSGRLGAAEAGIFGVGAAIAGLGYLLVFSTALASFFAGLTLVLYLFVYTPLKRHTVLNTLIGAVPGALPPVIGYAGASGRVDGLAWMLFAIVFVWQLPHFFAIAWMYREDYARGGYKMLSVVDPTGRSTRRQTVLFSLLLILVSLLPALGGHVGSVYAAAAGVFGLGLLAIALHMAADLTHASARAMLLASVIYLPAVMLLMLADRTFG